MKSIKEQFEVRPIPTEQTREWFLHKHYAKRMPSVVTQAFGLYEDKQLIGVLSYGIGGAERTMR